MDEGHFPDVEEGSDIELVTPNSKQWKALRGDFVAAQDGRCAICDTDLEDAAQLDHCHVTGFIRGALCSSCNVKLGWYELRRSKIETYLSNAAEFAAYAAAPRKSRGVRLKDYFRDRAGVKSA